MEKREYKNIKWITQLLEKVLFLERVLFIEEKHIPARLVLAHFFMEDGEIEKAIAEYDHITKILQDIYRKYKYEDYIPISSYPKYEQAKENQKGSKIIFYKTRVYF